MTAALTPKLRADLARSFRIKSMSIRWVFFARFFGKLKHAQYFPIVGGLTRKKMIFKIFFY